MHLPSFRGGKAASRHSEEAKPTWNLLTKRIKELSGISVKVIKLILTLMILCSTSAHGGSSDKIIDVNAGVGLPRLISFNLSINRLEPITFGFGLGTIPIENAARKYLDLDADDYIQEVDGYTITPAFSLTWKSYEYFIRWNPGGGSFYLHALYAVWSIQGDVSVSATGGELGTSNITLASASFKLIQPMVGLAAGWKWFFGSSDIYGDFSFGATKFSTPKYSIGTYTAADSYSGAIPDEDLAQLDEAKQMISDGIDDAMDQYKSQVQWGPIISLAIGIKL